jgi:L-amino acid N-acyltransferase YncA
LKAETAIERAPKLRRATIEDAPVLATLRKAFWQDQISKGLLDIPPLDDASLLASTESILKRPRTFVHLSFAGEMAAGYVYGQTRIVPGASSTLVAMIEELFVDTTLGSPSTALSLVRNLIADLKSSGATRIQAKVLSKNAISKKFFELCGFTLNLMYYEYDGSPT